MSGYRPGQEWSWPKRIGSGTSSVDQSGQAGESGGGSWSGVRAAAASLVTAAIGLAVAFGVDLSDAQQDAIVVAAGAFIALGAALFARRRR